MGSLQKRENLDKPAPRKYAHKLTNRTVIQLMNSSWL